MWAERFRQGADPEIIVSDQIIGEIASEIGSAAIDCGVEELAHIFHDWSRREAGYFEELARSAGIADCAAQYRKSILLDALPLICVIGCWLQGLSSSSELSDSSKLKVLTLFASDVGAGVPRASRYDRFKILLNEFGLSRHAVEPAELSISPDIADQAFRWPAQLLLMSRRPDRFMPELLGVDLAFRSLRRLPSLSGLKQRQGAQPAEAGFDLRDLGALGGHGNALSLSRSLAREVSLRDELLAPRMMAAAAWCFAMLREWSSQTRKNAERTIDPARGMRGLLAKRGAIASSYHRSTKLGPRCLSEWFSKADTDSDAFLVALAESRWVCPGDPDKSPLLTTLIDPAGPMFRIFTDEEVILMRRWIKSLGSPTRSPSEHLEPAQPAETSRPRAPRQGPSPVRMQPPHPRNLPLRDAYCLLQRNDGSLATREYAFHYARNWLARAEASLAAKKHALPKRWAANTLLGWVEARHDQQRTEFEDRATFEMPARGDVIDSTLQLAPLTLLDGKWLEGFTDWRLATSQIGHGLFATYWDELGNGQHDLNHPKIYRDVLREMGIELADVSSRDFAHDERFNEHSFRLPVYWQCVSRFPVTFMPEILGLNLAMELSGVGGGYLTARRFLRSHGFSTTFVDIHNTIDNIATGHTAWAVAAIDSYMLAATERHEDNGAQWQRIRIGYESLAPDRGPLSQLWGSALLAIARLSRAHPPVIRKRAYRPQVI